MPEIQIAAIICTHNREQYLGAAIDSLLEQDLEDYQVIVVDNASSDRTSAVVESRLPNPRLQYLYEPTLGLSVARNTGARSTKAPIVAYLDDDAIASRQWLRVLVEAYQSNPQLAIAGGKVSLILPEGRDLPDWISPSLAGALGLYDLGDEVVDIQEPGLTPRGLNYSIRRSFLEQIGGFDLNLGRVGQKLLSNEELYLTELALKQGWQVAYLPEAKVAHNVQPERLKRDWFLRRSWWQGVSECYREKIAGRSGWKQFPQGGEKFLRGLYNCGKNIFNPAQRFDSLAYAYGQLGYLNTVLRACLRSHRLA
jgi:glycosyltransferase involved in cell wall biosynthesis